MNLYAFQPDNRGSTVPMPILHPNYNPSTLYLGDVGVVSSPSALALVLCELLGTQDREHFVCIALTRQLRVIDSSVLSIGSDSLSVVDPKGILRWTLMLSRPAYGIVVCHNHPSGDSTPSVQDMDVTGRINIACKAVGLVLVDHLIVTHNETKPWYSFKQDGHIA